MRGSGEGIPSFQNPPRKAGVRPFHSIIKNGRINGDKADDPPIIIGVILDNVERIGRRNCFPLVQRRVNPAHGLHCKRSAVEFGQLEQAASGIRSTARRYDGYRFAVSVEQPVVAAIERQIVGCRSNWRDDPWDVRPSGRGSS